jgi:o-succinylbenzoate synthase
MQLVSLDIFPLRLPFREEFRIARGSVGSPEAGAPHIYVRVVGENGMEGWGEARPSHRWSYETEESVVSTIRDYLAPALEGVDLFDVDGIHRRMDRDIAPGISTGAPVAKSGVDMAIHDLLARSVGLPLGLFLGGSREPSVALTYLVSVASAAEAEARARQAWAQGYRGFKVKVGMGPARDLELLQAVRRAAPAAYLWADANQAYDAATASAQARAMEQLGVDVLEQPLAANDWTGLARLARETALPIAVDESVFSPGDLIQLVKLEAVDILVIKLSKMGGLARARLCVQIAREAGLGLLGSGLTESRLGLAAAVHLYGAFGGCAFADLNGPQFLADDPVAEGLDLVPGLAHVPTTPGIGVTIDAEKLAQYAVVAAA